MENNLQIFNNTEFGELGILIEGENILFPASECAKILGYSNHIKAINDHCKGVTKHYTLTNGGSQQKNYIGEGDLYRLITHSKLPNAVKFEAWIFEEVLPMVRKHGMYMTWKMVEEFILSPDTVIKLANQIKSEMAKNVKLSEELSIKNKLIAELGPKAAYAEYVLSCPGLVTITQIAKDYGMSGARMNGLLHELGIQYKQNGQWLLYWQFQDEGYTQSETSEIQLCDGFSVVKMMSKWTQEGRLFVYELLKAAGILPLIERKRVKQECGEANV
jgi:prophage antirepressor-like protein